jgi:Fatty acid synthase type I helical domain
MISFHKVTFPTAPHTEVTAKGDIVYSEVIRENVHKLEAYGEEMASGDTVSGAVNIQKVQDDVLKLWTVVKSQPGISLEQKNRIKVLYEALSVLSEKVLTLIVALEHGTVGPHLNSFAPRLPVLPLSLLTKFLSSI